MALNIYAGSTVANMRALPSPTELNPTSEMIWSEDTGRAQSGTNKAKMIGEVVAEKVTYAIKWGILSTKSGDTEFGYYGDIPNLLTKGFFYFGIGQTLAQAQSSAKKFYRSEISFSILPIGNEIYYKDCSVSVIEQ